MVLDGHSLTLEKLSLLGTGESKIELNDKSWKKLKEARSVVNRLAKQDSPVYGINTGVGIFSNVKLSE